MQVTRLLARLYAPIIIALFIALQFGPHLVSDKFIGRDSGVWLYGSWQMLEGSVIYRDIWDHKPPTIFFLNSVGLLIHENGSRGVALIELISLTGTSLLLYLLLKDLYGRQVALFALITTAVGFQSVGFGGNSTSSYALFPIAVSMYLLYRCTRFDSWVGLVVGMMFAITLTLKQNLILLQALALTIHLLSRLRNGGDKLLLLREASAIFLGFTAIMATYLAYFTLSDSFNDMWNAVITYNINYGTLEFSRGNIIDLFENLGFVLSLAIAGFLVSCAALIGEGPLYRGIKSKFLLIVLLAFMADFLLLVISSRSFPHYYQVLFPSISILVGASINYISDGLSGHSNMKVIGSNISPFTVFILGLLFIPVSLHFNLIYSNIARAINRDTDISKIVELVEDCTEQDDYVLMWGAESSVNFLTKRTSPTRFVYQYPLFVDKFGTEELVKEFLHDLTTKRPSLIIDTKNDSIPPLDSHERNNWTQNTRNKFYARNDQLMKLIDQFIMGNYMLGGSLSELDWDIYLSSEKAYPCDLMDYVDKS